MRSLPRAALLLNLVEKMRANGSWSGETHLQKAVYFLQDLLGVQADFGYVLYIHGPFSFDLRDELAGLCSDGLMTLEAHAPYGPRLQVTDLGKALEAKFPKTLERYTRKIKFVAEAFADKGVTELEQMGTALHVTAKARPGASVEERAKQLNRLKPHITVKQAEKVLRQVGKLKIRAARLTANQSRPRV